ncbi:asparagine synthase (glutamine-hydrolyzing) [Eisenibacter elegans]|uniref:asparagine synthase (glutamine-hydrolyzing) n=1 Tax=Eisenibacter elegans TaxID=997 RepID=UPI0003F9748C|nr:asparagine synthase (glutamine-hydrolyzing) [Eisenibacter elegans]
MCGIAGWFQPQNSPPLFTLEGLAAMTARLAHRGPDAEGLFADQYCALGHRRLSILDLSAAGQQPMISACGRYVVVYNGEIYNFRELAHTHQLALQGRSDTEVLLALFAKMGDACVHQLNGMFAWAIYDTHHHRIHLCRDRLGIKPLYYYWDGQRLAFASELKALKTLMGQANIPLQHHTEALSYYLQWGFIPAPYTAYTHIYKLPPAHQATLTIEGQWQLAPYWQLPTPRFPLITDLPTATEQLQDLLRSAVNYRLISDVPVGVFLSGGIDSSLVAALAAEVQASPIKTFSISFVEADFDEAPYAEGVAKALGTTHQTFRLSWQEAQTRLAQLPQLYDEPFADSSALPTLLLSQAARAEVSVALGGDGGDELFWGYGRYPLASRLQYLKALGNLRRMTGQGLSLAADLPLPSMQRARLAKAGQLLQLPTQHRQAYLFSQEQLFFSPQQAAELMGKPNPSLHWMYEPPAKLSAATRQSLWELQYYLPDDLLTKVDRASMACGLELRVPLLDYRVAEWSMQLSPKLKRFQGQDKYLLKQVLYRYLPSVMFERPKRGFAIPLAKWLQQDWHYLIEQHLSTENIRRVGLVDETLVQQYVQRFESGEYWRYHQLWALIVLHQFLEQG